MGHYQLFKNFREDILEAIKHVDWQPKWGEVRLSNMIKESKRYSEGKELASRNKKTRETLELLYEYGYNRK